MKIQPQLKLKTPIIKRIQKEVTDNNVTHQTTKYSATKTEEAAAETKEASTEAKETSTTKTSSDNPESVSTKEEQPSLETQESTKNTNQKDTPTSDEKRIQQKTHQQVSHLRMNIHLNLQKEQQMKI